MHEREATRLLRTVLVALAPAAVLVVFASAALWWWPTIQAVLGRRQPTDGVDFVVFYSAANLVAAGRAYELYHLGALTPIQHAAQPGIPPGVLPLAYFNPPFFALLLAPLSYLSFGHAFQVWSGSKLLLLAVDCWMIWRIAAPVARPYRVAAVAGFLTLQPVAFTIQLGQFSLILVTSWLGAYLLFRAGRDKAAGLALAPLLIKPELLFPVVLLLAWKRRTAALAALAGMTAAAVVVSLAMIGLHGLVDYPEFILDLSAHPGHGVNHHLMLGWNGFVTLALPGAGGQLQARAYASLSAVTLALAAHGWRGGWRADASGFASRWMMLTLCTVLIDAHFYIQDIALVMPVGIAVACEREGAARGVGAAALCVGWAILGFMTVVPEWRLHVFTLCMAGGLLWLVADAAARARRAADAGAQTGELPEPARAA